MAPRLLRSGWRSMTLATITLVVWGLAPVHAQLAVGASAPDFTLTDTQGISHSLSDYAGEVVVLYFVGYG